MNKINYKLGIKFECQGSGNCCVSRKSYGYVYLSNIDLKRFAKNFNLSICDFKSRYCEITDGYIHLAEKNNYNRIIVPGGQPPRAMLGYAFTALFFMLNHYGIINNSFKVYVDFSIFVHGGKFITKQRIHTF